MARNVSKVKWQQDLETTLISGKTRLKKTMKELNEKKKREDDYFVQKCIDIVDAIEELTDEQKADCNELFQSEMNRQIFVGTKNPKVRLIWLKKKISQVYLTC